MNWFNFLRRYKIALAFTRHFPYTDLPEDYWTIEDARRLSQFLTSPTGIKLRFIWRNKIADTSMRAVIEQSDHSKHLCGFAAGVRSTIAETDALLDLSRTKEGLIGLSDEEMEQLANRNDLR